MKRISFLALFALAFLVSCSKKEAEHAAVSPEINIDSLVTDLDADLVAKRSREVSEAFDKIGRKVMLNGTVLYAEQGRVVFKKAYGWQDVRRRRKPMTLDCQFQLASVSKMFTAEAVMILRSRGLIDYDDKVVKYIPDFPYAEVSIRHLLNHRSGLSRYESLAHEHWDSKRKPIFNDDVLRLFSEHKPNPYFEANNGFHYCNTNYVLLASLVERVSGQRFEDFVKQNVFDAIGMHNSLIYSMRSDSLVPTYIPVGVSGHDGTRRGYRKSQNDYLNGVMGDKIMFSTVDDLYRFSVALDHGLLIPDSLQEEAFKPGSPRARRRHENYGFGWRMSTDHPGMYFHYGWWKGYRSLVIRDKAHNRFLAVLTNTTQLIPDAVWDFISDTSLMLPEAEPWLQ